MFWKPEGSILPSMSGLVAKAVLEIPEWRQRYFERMKTLRASVVLPEPMTKRARVISVAFEPVLKAHDPAALNEQQNALEDFCHAMERRAKNRLESRMKTEGITADPGDPRGGAGFRLTRNRPEKYTLGTSTGTKLAMIFRG